jgi:hypothetical protein
MVDHESRFGNMEGQRVRSVVDANEKRIVCFNQECEKVGYLMNC